MKAEELNFIFKSLGERGIQGEAVKEYQENATFFILQQLSEHLDRTSQNCVVLRPYGSAAEDLKSTEPYDVGDVDIVIFPNSSKLMIHDELIEYLPEHPMHVRIKGVDHPVLQSCLVEGTEYLATSALKNFHPAIYGSSLLGFAEVQAHVTRLLSRTESSFVFPSTYHLKNNTRSPAVTVEIAQSLDTSLENVEMLKDPQNFVNLDESSWEWCAHKLYTARETDFARAYAKVASDVSNFVKDVEMSGAERRAGAPPQMYAALFQRLFWNDNIKARIRDVENPSDSESERRMENWSARAAVHNKDQRSAGPKKERSREHHSKGTLPYKDESSVRSQNANENQSFHSRGLELTSSQSTVRDISENSDQLSTQERMSKQVAQVTKDANGRSEETYYGEVRNNPHDSKTEEQHLTRRKGVNFKDQQRDPYGNKEDKNGLKKSRSTCIRNTSGRVDETKEDPSNETEFKDTGKHQFQKQVLSGIDYVPALKSLGWPQVAREWIKQERKWPSPDVVDNIVQEGFHLVVKPPKNGGNPDCDFRLSFAHAEYLLSQEMNDIQRECYRCLKKYHRAYLSTEAKGLVTFHLKNLLLQTIEETGVEMWTESNRAECMLTLLRNLFEALTKKDLRHFFVRSYNMFSFDYIEDPEILESLAKKVEHILENPMQFAKELIRNQASVDARQVKTEDSVQSRQVRPSAKSAPGQVHENGQTEEVTSKGADYTQLEERNSSYTNYGYHQLKDIFLAIGKELTDLAFDDAGKNGPIENLDAQEMSLVADLRELQRKHNLQVEMFPEMFNSCWDAVCCKVWFSNEPNVRRRVLLGIQGVVEINKYILKQDDFCPGNESVIMLRMLDPSVENPFDLSHIMPAGAGKQLCRMAYYKLESGPAKPPKIDKDDIPLD